MSTLTNTEIRNTYDALLKLADNGNLTTVLKEITDGLGNVTPLSISQIAVKSSVDLEASGFKTPTGTSSQFLRADGSIGDLTNYDNAYTHSQSAHAPSNAEQNIQSDWDSITGDSLILNKPTIPSGNQIIDWTGNSSGTIHITNLPATAITSVQIAATEIAMLALTTQEGDVVVRSDENKTYMHNSGTAGTIADFTELATPTSDVTSVDGATGAVVLDHDTLAGFVSNEHINWTADQGATNIHSGNYVNTTYTNVSEFINDAGYTGNQDLSGYLLNTTDTFNGNLTIDGQALISNSFPVLDFVDTNSFTDTADRFRVRAGVNNGQIQWYDDSTSSLTNLMTFSPNGDVVAGGDLTADNLSGTNTGDEPNATESLTGVVELATQAEVDAGNDTIRVITPATFKVKLSAQLAGHVKSYTRLISEITTSVVVTHSLVNLYPQVQVFEGVDLVVCEVENTDSLTTTLKFNTAPTTNQYRVVIHG